LSGFSAAVRLPSPQAIKEHGMGLVDEIQALRAGALTKLAAADTPEALEGWRVAHLGVRGAVRAAQQKLREVPAPQRPSAGRAFNEMKDTLQDCYRRRAAEIGAGATRPAGARVDITEPGRHVPIGRTHVITQTVNEICDIFGRMGFTVAYGPEVDDDWHSFDALNIPPSHVARDELNSFYVSDHAILRSHTSTVQIRVMEKQSPPVRIIAPGRVYRPDTVDATHSFMFHQVEGLYVDEGVSMSDLKTSLDQFCKAYFGPRVATRFRPSFFPFTEPSAEVDMSCNRCAGDDRACPICKGTGWLELGGCGMVHVNVLNAVGYDAERFTGFAFGLGIDRSVMQKHSIPDIRLLFENDVRFLHQF